MEWDGLRHDSRDPLYRSPGGAVPAGTPVVLRFRTFADDVTGVKVRFYSVDLGGQQIVAMSRAASGVSCYDAALAAELCDFWQVTLPAGHGEDNLWYRFIVTDGTDTDYYADDTAALDGGLGRTDGRRGRHELGAHALQARVQGARVGAGRGHLPDLPGPLPQRAVQQRPQDRRRPVRRPGDRDRLGRAAGGLLPQLRGGHGPDLPLAVRRDARPGSSSPADATTPAAT